VGKDVNGVIEQFNRPVEELLNDASSFIKEIRTCGLHIIDLIITDNKEIKDSSTKVPMLISRDMLEYLDSVSVLMKKGCTYGAIPLLRTVLELYLSIMFMLKDDFENRAITYEVCHIHKRLEAGEFLKQNYGEDVDDDIKVLQEKLGEPGYLEASCRWEKYKEKNGYPPNWYKITNRRCSSVKKLAEETGKLAMYNIVYSYYSMYAHGVMALVNQGDQLRITPLRTPHMVSLTCRFCLNLASDVYYRFVAVYLRTEDKARLDKWYSVMLRQHLDKIKADEKAIGMS